MNSWDPGMKIGRFTSTLPKTEAMPNIIDPKRNGTKGYKPGPYDGMCPIVLDMSPIIEPLGERIDIEDV